MNCKKAIPVVAVLSLSLLPGAWAGLTVARHTHSNTLLPDGDFLVVGGLTGAGAGTTPTDSAEIYFTSAARFSSIHVFNDARSSHTATVLGDGRVLIAGGFDASGTPLNSAYIFDNQTHSWDGTEYQMSVARGGHTANLINTGPDAGDVLLCGGQTAAGLSNITNTCEIFMRSTIGASPPHFKTAASMNMATARMNHAAAALSSGNIFISGGIRWDAAAGEAVYLPDNEIYDVVKGIWTPVTALLQGRAYHTITTLNNGNILITGGYNGNGDINDNADSANLFDLETDEKWYYENRAVPAVAAQNAGSHGYLDAAEFFDPNGGRVPVNGAAFSVMPYRMRFHAAALTPNAKVGLDGGYGNMVAKFFTASPSASAGAYLRLTPSTLSTATIDADSYIVFPLNITLPRPVSGRVVNGDIFFSLPKTASAASFTVATAKAQLERSTAPLDGLPIGKVTSPSISAGTFATEVTLQNPRGTVNFKPEKLAIEGAQGGAATFAFADVSPRGSSFLQAGSDATLTVTFNLPGQFYSSDPANPSHLEGEATITAGAIIDDAGAYNITLTGGTGAVPTTVIGYDDALGKALVTVSIPFADLTGKITNPSTYQILLPGDVNIVADSINLTMDLKYTSDFVDLSGSPYNFNTSSFVVREMIFSTNLDFKPGDFTWDTAHTAYDSDLPLFNHTYMVTPAGDELMVGGRNCEAAPASDCPRGIRNFGALTVRKVIVTIPEADQESGGWTAETSLKEKRAYHTSTLLPDGSILTCGGSDGVATSKTCELRDPDTGEWSYTEGTMSSPRSRHTATLLPNSTVLIAGGTTGPSTAAVATAEIYYPKVKRFVSVLNMASPRQNHTATLQSDGNVLVAGGSADGYLDSAEIFIATAGAWQTTGSLTQGGRAQHTATLLKDGTVMVTGGINGVALKTTEIYSNGTWTYNPAKDLNTARYSHSATLLEDGRVSVIGGSDGAGPLVTTEFYNGSSWNISGDIQYKRANHKATLLTSGKIMLTGGETLGAARDKAEIYNTDFDFWSDFGIPESRSNHTAVLANDGNVYIMGGWNGTEYLDTVQSVYFAPFPDLYGLAPKNRNPQVSTAAVNPNTGEMGFVDYLDRNQSLTLMSDATNFHGVTEASGGGAGAASSSFHNPRVYLQAVDAPSGFLTDLTTRIYPLYGGANSSWQNTLSSITVVLPATAQEMPYGYYYARTEANGQYSAGRVVQVSIPRPTGLATNIVGQVIGTSSMSWTWNQGTIDSLTHTVNGYNLYSSTDNLFISTVAFTDPAAFTQTGLTPNSETAISIAAYNIGGDGPLSPSNTYYTLAAVPTDLRITAASFETASLTWNPNGNSKGTRYEISVYEQIGAAIVEPPFSYAANISTPVPFANNHTSTSAVITTLSPNKIYHFRIRAVNGSSITTAFSATVSTITVGNIINLNGTARSGSAINWSWDNSLGATSYEVYDVLSGTVPGTGPGYAHYIGSSTDNSFTQVNLSTNSLYKVSVNAVADTTNSNPNYGILRGPTAFSKGVYTLAVTPLVNGMNTYTDVSTGSFIVNWVTNGNSTHTLFTAYVSTRPDFTDAVTQTVTGSTATYNGLKPNYRYYAKVIATNGDNIDADPLLLGSKYTMAQSPSNVRATTITMSGISLEWYTGENSTETIYEVRASSLGFGASMSPIMAFSRFYTDSKLEHTGLLTSTTYYYDVAARNGEGLPDSPARIDCVPNPVTLPGPGGAPFGSLATISDPENDVTLHGTLPNAREVWLTLPAAAYTRPTAVAISSSSADNCSFLVGGTRPLAIAVYSEDAIPQVPVSITLSYNANEANAGVNGIDSNRARLIMARYNESLDQCLPLETRINDAGRTITTTTNHFSIFQLMLSTAAANLNDIRVFPNPFYTNRGNGYVTMDHMPASAKVRIYTLSGDKVWEGVAGTTGFILWKGVNKSGELVGSGIYLAVIDAASGKKIVKIAVER